MKKHVVFLCHGLGEQVPGETVDEVVGAACEQLDLDGPVVNNTLHLAKKSDQKEDILNLFPSHQRRMNGPNEDEELVFAEVHWADISPAPSGFAATALDLLRLVLGMGYIALDNVQNNGTNASPFVRYALPWFVWLFYAVIAPLNLFLLVGASALLIDPFVFEFSENAVGTYVVFAAIGIFFAYFGHRQAGSAKTYLDRMIMRGLAVCGAIMMAFAVLFLANVPLGFLNFASELCQNQSASESKLEAVNNLKCFTGLGVFALQGSWLIAIFVLNVMALASLGGFNKDLWDKRSIYLAVCSGMLILWMTFTVAIWALLVQAVESLPLGDTAPAKEIISMSFKEATQTLVYGVFCLVMLVGVGMFVAWRRGKLRDQLSATGSEHSDIDKKYGRVILNPLLNIALIIGIAALSFSAYVAFAEFVFDDPKDWIPTNTLQTIYQTAHAFDARVKQWQTVAFFVITAIGFIMFNFSSIIASGVGIARDVTTSLTRSERDNPMLDDEKHVYVFADEIQARFHAVVSHMIAQERDADISRITFLTHSQGTVIAAKGLAEIAEDMPVEPTLITMGSPLTRIYGHYFKDNYQFTLETNGALKAWHNIYRGDDFVGTHVTGHGTEAQNHKIRAKGHSHYWSDPVVWEHFKKMGVF